jgi:hypothetical protein
MEWQKKEEGKRKMEAKKENDLKGGEGRDRATV